MAKTTIVHESWSALYDAQRNNYETIVGIDHNWDTKAGVLLAAIFTVSIFAVTRQLFSTDDKLLFSILIIGCFLYVCASILILASLMPKNYPLPANNTKDQPDYLTKEHGELMYQLIVDIESSAETIRGWVRVKSILFTIATLCFTVGSVLLLVVKLGVA